MFINFNKVFNEKPQTEVEVPQAMLDYMSKKLPVGLKYIAQENGYCTIVGDGREITLGGFSFKPTAEDIKILGKKYTFSDVMTYFYNAQKMMPLTLNNDGYITINGQDVEISQLKYNPLLPSVEYVSGSFFALPPKFPPAFKITLGVADGTYSRVLMVSRVPNESLHILKFESKEAEPLMIRYSVDEKNKKLNMVLSYNLKYAKSIRDIVESTMIYNAYFSNNALLNGRPLSVSMCDTNAKKFDVASALFWEKVLKVEECLGAHFIPPMDDVPNKDILLAERLYQNLIEHQPIREKHKLTSITGKWDFEDSDKSIVDSIGVPMFFRYVSERSVELFGYKFSLPILTGVCNTKIKEVVTNDETTQLVLEDASIDMKQYVCSMFFATTDELEKYIEVNVNELVTRFKNAKNVE